MPVILALDAAWTETEPSGVALLAGRNRKWKCLCVAPSYEAFYACACGGRVDWGQPKFGGCSPDVGELLKAARAIAGADVNLVAIDMPLATVPFSRRRAADDAISRAFGGRGCSAHSPNAIRPGPLGARLMAELRKAGYPLATVEGTMRATGNTIEVYPHPALLALLGVSCRFPYKAQKSSRYWPDVSLRGRIKELLRQFGAIRSALENHLGKTGVPLPPAHEVSTLSTLKRYEDGLDALVSAWVGTQFLAGDATAYGDSTAAVWIPRSN